MKVKTGLKAGKPLGDTVADFTHATGLNKLAETYTRVTGRDCGCEKRRRLLNRISPEVVVGR
jgi:hypothetical protein